MDLFLQVAAFVAAVVGGLGYAVGAYRRSKDQAKQGALDTALAEVQTYRDKCDRLELELTKETTLRVSVENERDILTGILAGGVRLADPVAKIIRDETQSALTLIREAM